MRGANAWDVLFTRRTIIVERTFSLGYSCTELSSDSSRGARLLLRSSNQPQLHPHQISLSGQVQNRRQIKASTAEGISRGISKES